MTEQTNFGEIEALDNIGGDPSSTANWEKEILSDVIEINNYPPLQKGEKHRYIAMGDLDVNDRHIKGSEIKEYKYSAPRFSNGDTLFPKMSRCLENGKTAFVDVLSKEEVAFGSTEFVIMTPTKRVLPKFVYYIARRPDVVRKAFKWRNGTTARRQRISTDVFDHIEIEIPPLEEQEKIVYLLDGIDSEIEVLESEAEKLERTGEEIFSNFLRDLREDEYENEFFSQLADFDDGKAFSQDEWTDEGQPIIKIDELNSGISRRTDRYNSEVEDMYYLTPGDVLFAWSASLGVYYWNKDYGILNQHIFNVEPKSYVSKEFLYFALKHSMDEFLTLAHGTTTKHINRSALSEVKVELPDEDLLEEFTEIVQPIYRKMVHNGLQIQRLEEMRDTLLPKLMSGTRRVGDIKLGENSDG